MSQLNFNVIGVGLRFIGTHFDHNQYIIRIFIFCFYIDSYGAMQSFLLQGGSRNFFSKIIIFVGSEPFNVLEVGGKKLNQNFTIYHPSLFEEAATECLNGIYTKTMPVKCSIGP